MLDRTIHNLEDFLKVAIEYFQPTRLNCVRMKGSEVAGAVEALVRAECADDGVDLAAVGCAPDMALLVDPSRLSTALRIVVRQLRGASSVGGPSLRLRARVQRERKLGVEGLQISIDPTEALPEAAPRRAAQVVEWAVAKKFIEMHGGELVLREPQEGTVACVVFLPFCS
jgi:hypothetical protein